MSGPRRVAVLDVAIPQPAGPLAMLIQRLQRVIGFTVSLNTATLLAEMAGYTVTNAAAAPGTALPETRTLLDFADAGVDQLRLVVRGNNSTAAAVTVSLYDVTNSVTLATVTVTGATPTTYAGAWTPITPTGSDQEVEVRVTGDGAVDPVLYNVHVQMRTAQARR